MTADSLAIVQDWLAAEAGSERVALELARMFPAASIHTSFFNERIFEGELADRRVSTWPLQRFAGAARRFRWFLPLYPVWFSSLDLREYDLVISSSVAFTHAVRTSANAIHVAYVHTPLRYAWDLESYLRGSSVGRPGRIGSRLIQPLLQGWDRRAGQRPDVLIANSNTVRSRISRVWGRDAEVVYPPVDVADIKVSRQDEGFLLVAARLLAYRRIDLAVNAANLLGRELVVVGEGPERRRLESLAGPTVHFVGRVSRDRLLELFATCHAYLAPGVEDFGIAPVEAMAAGKPVVGLRAGGVGETVIDGATGVLVDEASALSLAAAVEHLDKLKLDALTIRDRAEQFDASLFREKFREVLLRSGVNV